MIMEIDMAEVILILMSMLGVMVWVVITVMVRVWMMTSLGFRLGLDYSKGWG